MTSITPLDQSAEGVGGLEGPTHDPGPAGMETETKEPVGKRKSMLPAPKTFSKLRPPSAGLKPTQGSKVENIDQGGLNTTTVIKPESAQGGLNTTTVIKPESAQGGLDTTTVIKPMSKIPGKNLNSTVMVDKAIKGQKPEPSGHNTTTIIKPDSKIPGRSLNTTVNVENGSNPTNLIKPGFKIPGPNTNVTVTVEGKTQRNLNSTMQLDKPRSKPTAIANLNATFDKDHESSPEPSVNYQEGDRVSVSGVKTGTLRFVGKIHFAEGTWCGVALDSPEGSHDGLVQGVRYFQCEPNHGLFAPLHKLQPVVEDLYLYDSPVEGAHVLGLSDIHSGDEDSSLSQWRDRSPASDKSSRLPQPSARGRSPDLNGTKTLPRYQSKLTRPKAVSRSLSAGTRGDFDFADSTSSSRDSSTGRDDGSGGPTKPSRLPLQGKGPPRRAEKRPAKEPGRNTGAETDQDVKANGTQGKKTKTSHQRSLSQPLDGTFVLEEPGDSLEEEIPETKIIPRVDSHTALTLAYNVESSGSDSDSKKPTKNPASPQGKLNSTFVKDEDEENGGENGGLNATFDVAGAANATFRKDSPDPRNKKRHFAGMGLVPSPMPDLLRSTGLGRRVSLEWEDEPFPGRYEDDNDLMYASMASSMGLLSDTQLLENSLFGDDFKDAIAKKPAEGKSFVAEGKSYVQEGKSYNPAGETAASLGILSDTQMAGSFTLNQTQHLMDVIHDAEVDLEIAGIVTPVDMSSSTISGKDESSSPEPEALPTSDHLDVTFDVNQVQTSTPLSPQPTQHQGALKSAGEKLATPVSEAVTAIREQMITTKLYSDQMQGKPQTCGTFNIGDKSQENMDVDQESLRKTEGTFVVTEKDVTKDGYVPVSTKRKRTSMDEEEVKCHRMSASFELAKTAVEQYASLVKGAEQEKAYQGQRMRDKAKFDLMAYSLEGRVAKLVMEDAEGIMGVTLPTDNMLMSFTRDSEERTSGESSPVGSEVKVIGGGHGVTIEDLIPELVIHAEDAEIDQKHVENKEIRQDTDIPSKKHVIIDKNVPDLKPEDSKMDDDTQTRQGSTDSAIKNPTDVETIDVKPASEHIDKARDLTQTAVCLNKTVDIESTAASHDGTFVLTPATHVKPKNASFVVSEVEIPSRGDGLDEEGPNEAHSTCLSLKPSSHDTKQQAKKMNTTIDLPDGSIPDQSQQQGSDYGGFPLGEIPRPREVELLSVNKGGSLTENRFSQDSLEENQEYQDSLDGDGYLSEQEDGLQRASSTCLDLTCGIAAVSEKDIYTKPNVTRTLNVTQNLNGTQTLDGTHTLNVTQNLNRTQTLDGTHTLDVTQNLNGTQTLDGTQTLNVTRNLNGTQTLDGTQTLNVTQNLNRTQALDGTHTLNVTQNLTKNLNETGTQNVAQDLHGTHALNVTETIESKLDKTVDISSHGVTDLEDLPCVQSIKGQSLVDLDHVTYVPEEELLAGIGHVTIGHKQLLAGGDHMTMDPEQEQLLASGDHMTMDPEQEQLLASGDHMTMAPEQEQLLADLEAGHTRNERPVSMVSTCSADTGIVVDYTGSAGGTDKNQRPVSIVSTSSVDTGYQPDTDADTVTMATLSPQEDTPPLGAVLQRPGPGQDPPASVEDNNISDSQGVKSPHMEEPRESSPRQESGASRPQAGSPVELEPSPAEPEAERDNGDQAESENGETSGTESQQNEEEGTEEDITIQEAVSPEADMEHDHLIPEDDHMISGHVTAQQSTDDIRAESSPTEDMEIEDIPVPIATSSQDIIDTNQDDALIATAACCDVAITTDVPEVELFPVETEQMEEAELVMVESATMKDVMEKVSAPDLLVHDLKVHAHIEEREIEEIEVVSMETSMEAQELPHIDTSEELEQQIEELAIEGIESLEDNSKENIETGSQGQEELGQGQGELGQGQQNDTEQQLTDTVKINVECVDDKQSETKSSTKKSTSKVLGKEKGLKVKAGDAKTAARSPRKRKDSPSRTPSSSLSKNPRPPRNVDSSPNPDNKTRKSNASPKPNIKSASKSDVKKEIKSKVDSLKKDNGKSLKINKSEDEITKKTPNKLLKNVVNKKKVEASPNPDISSLVKTSTEKSSPKLKPSSPAKEKERRLAKARKQLDLIPNVDPASVSPHLTTIEAHPVIVSSASEAGSNDGGNSDAKPPARRSLARPKWSSTGDRAKEGDRAGGPNPKAGQPGIPKPSRLAAPRPTATSAKRTSGSSMDFKVPNKVPTASRGVSRLAPKGGSTSDRQTSESQQSLGSDGGSTTRSRPSSATRAANPTTASLRRGDRSSSFGSDSQLSDISQVSSQGQGQKSVPSSKGSPSNNRTSTIGKRRSMVEPSVNKKPPADPRRLSLAANGARGSLKPLATSTPAPKRVANQNKNKSRVTGSPSAQRPHQPDVVTTSVASSVSQEVTRLEALCEARTKELNKIKMQLRHRNTGFEAMATLVKYLTEELNAFSCPLVTAQLADAQGQLQRAAVQLEELTAQRDALIAEIQCIKQAAEDEADRLRNDHQTALEQLTERLQHERDEEVKQMKDKHSEEVVTMKVQHERKLCEVQTNKDRLLEEKEKHYTEELTRRKEEHERHFNELHQEQESKLSEITMRFESIKVNLLEKVEYLRQEGEDLRRREASMMEKCQRDSEYQMQHALASYKQEVDSLRAVLDLRNSEIHDLRLKNVELEELPKAREMVKMLEQKIENLQAIIDIRTGNERSLSEKHSVLLRKYDRDSKAMKRMSMDNEELMWRLSQSDSSSPDALRRSVSHSPTNSECSTPEPTRRRKSPLPPHSPRSPTLKSPPGVVMRHKQTPSSSRHSNHDQSPPVTLRTPPKSNLRRAGTYEILSQDTDSEGNTSANGNSNSMKQSNV